MARLRFFFFCLLALFLVHCSDDSPTSDTDDSTINGNGDTEPVSTQSTVTPTSSTSLTVTSKQGVTYSLEIPAGSVSAVTVVTMTTLTEPPESPYARSVVPGVRIEPEGLELNEPAILTVTFADPPDSIEFCALYHMESPGRAILLDYYDDTETTIGGGIVYAGDYGCCMLMSDEVDQQAELVESELDVMNSESTLKPPGILAEHDPFDWRKAYRFAGWALHMIRAKTLFGKDEDAKKLKKKLDETLEDTVKKFLEKKVDDMCDPEYQRALGKYWMMVKNLGVGSSGLDEQLTARLSEVMDRCSSLFQLDIFEDLTTLYVDGKDNLQFKGTVEFYIPYFTSGSGEYGELKGQGTLDVSGGGSTESDDGKEKATWTYSGKVDVTVGGKLDYTLVGDFYELQLQIELTLDYNVYQEKERCFYHDDDVKCYDESGSTMVGAGPGFTINMPLKNEHTIEQPFGQGTTTGIIRYTLYILNSRF